MDVELLCLSLGEILIRSAYSLLKLPQKRSTKCVFEILSPWKSINLIYWKDLWYIRYQPLLLFAIVSYSRWRWMNIHEEPDWRNLICKALLGANVQYSRNWICEHSVRLCRSFLETKWLAYRSISLSCYANGSTNGTDTRVLLLVLLFNC